MGKFKGLPTIYEDKLVERIPSLAEAPASHKTIMGLWVFGLESGEIAQRAGIKKKDVEIIVQRYDPENALRGQVELQNVITYHASVSARDFAMQQVFNAMADVDNGGSIITQKCLAKLAISWQMLANNLSKAEPEKANGMRFCAMELKSYLDKGKVMSPDEWVTLASKANELSKRVGTLADKQKSTEELMKEL